MALNHPKSVIVKSTVKYEFKLTLNKATLTKGSDKKLKYKKLSKVN